MTEKTLNKNQAAAVRHKDGPMMVLAGPGSGKTAVITYRALCLAREHGVAPRDMLVITYSKAAATQMRERYLALGGDASATFGTFHAIFFRVLRARYQYTAEQVLTDDERRAAVKRMLAARKYDLEDEFVGQVLNELSLVRNELFELKYYHAVSIGADDFQSILDEYDAYKSENQKIDFDDMLCQCLSLFKQEPETLEKWRARFPYIMIDEFQDINRVQYECIKLLAAPTYNLLAVGDDDQSIYRFRGARPEFLLHFPQDCPDTQRVVLDRNYRSTDPIIDCANKLIAGNRIRYGKRITGTERQGDLPQKLIAADQNAEAAAIAEKIKALHKKGVSYGAFAVIYRVNMQNRAFIDAFLHANIPYQVKDEAPIIYEHWIAKDFFAYLRLAGQPLPAAYDADAERVINKPYRYISKAFLQGAKLAGKSPFALYARDPALNDLQRARIEELMADLKAAGRRKPVDAVRYIRQGIGYDRHIKDHCTYRRLDPAGLFEIADELQEAAKQFETAEDFLAHAKEAIDAAKQNKKPQGPCVTLTTMHSAKGLEFDTVFIAGAVEGVIPHERSKTEAELEEERRLLYVGVTRAKDALYLSLSRTRYDKEAKPSRFLTGLA